MKRAVIYVRVSTEEQAKHGYSLGQQAQECIDFADKNGYEVAEIFTEEGESAKNLVRTELKKLFTYCAKNKQKIDGLIFWRWDRLSRGEQTDYYKLFKFFKVNNITPLSVRENNEDTPEGELLRWITQGTSRYEWRKIGDRTKLGLKGAMLRGRWVSLAPVGYLNDPEPNREKNKSLIPCPVNAKHIKKIFELFNTGLYTKTEILSEVKKDGFRTNDMKNAVDRILRRHIYRGYVDNKALKEPVKGIFEPLIDDKTFYRAQELFEGKKSKIIECPLNKEDKLAFPLKKFIKCPNCGRNLTASLSKGNGGKFPYYHCYNVNCNKKFRMTKTQLETDFLEHLSEITPRQEIIEIMRKMSKEIYKSEISTRLKRDKQFRSELEALELKKKRLMDKYVDDMISKEDFDAMNARLIADISKFKAEICLNEIPKDDFEKCLNYCCDSIAHLNELWNGGDADFKYKLQSIIYPRGLTYDKNIFRTTHKSLLIQELESIDVAVNTKKKVHEQNVENSTFRTNEKSLVDCSSEGLHCSNLKMGRMMGFEPTYIGTTSRGLNRLTTPAISFGNIII